ncbi:FAD-binding protein [Campylobacter sp. 19-13652]|uniref:FAD-binding protein n=1 Tax=Campylobacter sp. 19-13652 TaxID=2840180 RepID=UPI001C751BF8|nr:FAD-binding protein [Campylobacter sp. 19-13652]BCX80154.1 protein FixB [Campylobacter sp. 19-13652]
MSVYIYADTASRLAELISAAASLSEDFSVIVTTSEITKLASELGASKIVQINGSSEIAESNAETIASVVNGGGVLLLASTRSGKALAALLGESLKAGVCTEALSLSKSDAGVLCEKMVYGGLAISEQLIKTDLAIIALAAGSYPPATPNPKDSEVKSVEFIPPKQAIKLIKTTPKQASSVELAKAKKIVAVGRGFSRRDDLAMTQSLCEIVGAELGCTRPIAESERWLDRDRYIGISSVMAKPQIYIGIGVSGQVQHMVGVKDSEKIIAINKDENAPIFEYADYGIVGDLNKILPRLIAALG